MSDDSLVLTTTTDSAANAQHAVDGDTTAGRVPAPTNTASYEHPRSERTMLLERLAEAEKELSELVNPEDEPVQRVLTNEADHANPPNFDELRSSPQNAGAHSSCAIPLPTGYANSHCDIQHRAGNGQTTPLALI